MKTTPRLARATLILAAFLSLGGRLWAALDDYAAYFPFDDNSASLGSPTLELEPLGAPQFDENEKIAGKASSRALRGGIGWRVVDPQEIRRLVPRVFTFSFWFRFDGGKGGGLAHLLHRWTGDRTTRIFSFSAWTGYRDPQGGELYGIEATLQGAKLDGPNEGAAGGGVQRLMLEREAWYHAVFMVNGQREDRERKTLTVWLTPRKDASLNLTPVRSESLGDPTAEVAQNQEVPLCLQSSPFVPSSCSGTWMDEAVFYSRLLEEKELEQLFQLGKQGRSLPPPGKSAGVPGKTGK